MNDQQNSTNDGFKKKGLGNKKNDPIVCSPAELHCNERFKMHLKNAWIPGRNKENYLEGYIFA